MIISASTYVLISCAIFLLLGIIWSSRNWLNVFIKLFFILFAAYGFYIGLLTSGVVFSVGGVVIQAH